MARDTRKKSSDKRTAVKLVVGPFRGAFMKIWEPEETDNGPRYSATMLFPPDSKSIKQIDDAFFHVMDEDFGPESDWPSSKKDTLPEDKFYDAGKKDYNGYKPGWMVLKAASVDQPGVVDADKEEVLNKREVYNGRWYRAEIVITTFDNTSKGCTAYLNHIQCLDHDEAFSGKGNAADAFDSYTLKNDSGGRRSRDDDEEDRGSRRGGRADRDEERGRGSRDQGRGSDRDRDTERGGRSGRDDERSSRSRDREDDDRSSRSRGRGRDDAEDEDRSSRRGRDEDRGRSSRDEDDDRSGRSSRSSGRGRDDDDDRNSRRSRNDDDDWN